MSKTIRDPEEIARRLGLGEREVKTMKKISEGRVIGISEYQIGLMDPEDPNCPIRRMFLPSENELDPSGEWDTSGEASNTVLPGVQHKYRETAVFLTTNKCAAFCRFCFRKRATIEKGGKDCSEILVDIEKAVKYVKSHSEISNVLITGGDPLTLPTGKLGEIIEPLTKIKHLDFIRIGTRLFPSDPSSVTNRLLDFLDQYSQKKKILLVTHFNHPKEVSKKAISAVRRARNLGFQIYSQTVFLNGVNDNADTLVELFKKLTAISVTPYYIFQCRPVRGTAHFSVPFVRGFKIIQETRSRLSGPAKLFNFSMSHITGKMEIINIADVVGERAIIELKYHQEKDLTNPRKCFTQWINIDDCWLPDKLDA